ncbi:MAG: response regulator transcription factor [Candidatus Margulisbacteria bacterium]|nr:response regulator transcription factor [Candidatus Margulisiibacteriota bacterium]
MIFTKKQKRILIIEDNKEASSLLKDMLQADGYDIIQSYDGSKGVEMALQEIPDLIILDVMLPGKDGFSVCSNLKFKFNKTKNIPVIMLTARHEDISKDKGFIVGADIYMTKPFDPGEMLANVKKLINHG